MTGQESSSGFCVDSAFSYCAAIGYRENGRSTQMFLLLCVLNYVGGEILASKEQLIQYTKFLRPVCIFFVHN